MRAFFKTLRAISIDNLADIIYHSENNKENRDLFFDVFGKVSSANGYGSSFIQTPDNGLFRQITIHERNDKIESILFRGAFDLTFHMLVERYKTYRRVYVPYDDRFEYFFNEDKRLGNHIIHVFAYDGDGELEQNPNRNLNNLEVCWND